MTSFDYVFYDETLLSKNPVFVEVGSHSGRLGNFLKDKGKVIIYEPSKVNFKKLEKIITGVTLWNKAIDRFNGDIEFFDYKGRPSSASIFHKKLSILDKYRVPVVNLQTIFEENKIKKIDLLVLTCEGCELGVLDTVDKYDIKQICCSFSDRIYGDKIKQETIELLSTKYTIIEGVLKWKFHLLIKK